MAIRGSLREASLPDVLQLLSMGKKSGCLSVAHRSAFGSIYFDRGRINFASIVNRPDRLGDLLVSSGVLSRGELDQAIAQQRREPHRRLGELLMALQFLTREALHQHIRQQIEEAVYHLFTWTQGTFSFEADQAPEEQDFLVSINPESLLLEGARRVDEWSQIEKKIPSFDLIFAVDRAHVAASGVELTDEQETILPFINGERDVEDIQSATGLSEFDVGKALFGLATAGFLHRIGRKVAAPVGPSIGARIAEHRNLGIAFYKSGMLDEAMREFRRVIELRDHDEIAGFYLGMLALRQGRLDDALRTLRSVSAVVPQSGAVAANLAYAYERIGRYDEARAAVARAELLLPDDPTVKLTGAVLALRRGDVEAADATLRAMATVGGSRARTAPWYHYAGLAAAYLGDLDRVISVLTEGCAAFPHATALSNNLAVVLERCGRLDEAVATIERGLQENPSCAQLHKNLGDLHYRAGNDDVALDAYSRAVRLVPDLGGDVWLKLGNLRHRRGESEDAVRCWERSLALAPDNPVARSNLDMARLQA